MKPRDWQDRYYDGDDLDDEIYIASLDFLEDLEYADFLEEFDFLEEEDDGLE